MPRILNKHRAALDVQALPQELEETARASEENLATKAATVEVVPVGLEDGRLGGGRGGHQPGRAQGALGLSLPAGLDPSDGPRRRLGR